MVELVQQASNTYNLLKKAFKPGTSERSNNKSHFDNIVKHLITLKNMFDNIPDGGGPYGKVVEKLNQIMEEITNPELESHVTLNDVRERTKSHFFNIFGTEMELTEGGRRMSYRSRKMKKHKKSKSYKKIRRGKRTKRRRY